MLYNDNVNSSSVEPGCAGSCGRGYRWLFVSLDLGQRSVKFSQMDTFCASVEDCQLRFRSRSGPVPTFQVKSFSQRLTNDDESLEFLRATESIQITIYHRCSNVKMIRLFVVLLRLCIRWEAWQEACQQILDSLLIDYKIKLAN